MDLASSVEIFTVSSLGLVCLFVFFAILVLFQPEHGSFVECCRLENPGYPGQISGPFLVLESWYSVGDFSVVKKIVALSRQAVFLC